MDEAPSSQGAPTLIDSPVLGVQEQGISDSRRIEALTVNPTVQTVKLQHAWLSSLRKTDGLKFLSLFRMIFFFSGTGELSLPLPLMCTAALMWKIQGVMIG